MIVKDDPVHRKMYLILREELAKYEHDGGVLLEIETSKQGREWMWKNNTLQEGRDRIWDDIESQIREANDVEIEDLLHEDWGNNDTDLEFDDEAAADPAPSMSTIYSSFSGMPLFQADFH